MDKICHPLTFARRQRRLSQEGFAREVRAAAARRGIPSGCRRLRVYTHQAGWPSAETDFKIQPSGERGR
ncbi:hypothetical protein [Streptomyces sp. NPDC016845]|uniref:hypothetical protein n=1 Tax=Streptomyces sp. NPDC016845 TaxID=3364972 RepID=UPI0037A49DC6